jgi:ribonuclease BN (tRNA processing enzyme)
MFFTGDHEPYDNIYRPEDDEHAEYQRLIEEKQRRVDAVLAGVDILVADCSYTAEEYPAKRGWGHGTFDSSIELARRAGARRLVCTHHEPTRTDDELERVFAEALARHPRREGDPEILLSYEGLEIDL